MRRILPYWWWIKRRRALAGGGTPPDYTPSLDFSDARNSMYIGLVF